jgi:cobyrinic acid a,c-diamide synthase
MCGEEGVLRSFAVGSIGAEVAIIEGVMGLFDGAKGDDDGGSSAEVARLLDAPVVLVIDAKGQARSVAALVKGFVEFDPRLRFSGIILNRVASPRHAELLSAAITSVPGLPPLLGCLPRAPEVELSSRHLGLVTAGDVACDADYFARLADWLEAGVDVKRLLAQIPQPLSPRTQKAGLKERVAAGRGRGMDVKVRIAVARDAAFCFCYPENLERLEAAGAELAFFSPLVDAHLPAGCAGLYLPGGYPELHAARLADNTTLLMDIRSFAASGQPVYAECGGLIYLSQGVEGAALVGLFPATAHMLPQRKALGYREVTFTRDTILGSAGTVARGHEFHYSELAMPDAIERAWRLTRADGVALADEGFVSGNVLASYVHLHFASNPALAESFVAACWKAD